MRWLGCALVLLTISGCELGDAGIRFRSAAPASGPGMSTTGMSTTGMSTTGMSTTGMSTTGMSTTGMTGAGMASSATRGVIAISPANTRIEFTGSKGPISHTGRFTAFSGTLELRTNDPKDAQIRVAVDMDSITTSIWLLTKHLKSADFFDVARYPGAEFVSDMISPMETNGTYQVVGRLTLHGTQQPVSFPARIAISGGEIVFDGTMTVRQTAFGMVEAARKANDDVPVHVTIRERKS